VRLTISDPPVGDAPPSQPVGPRRSLTVVPAVHLRASG